MGWAAEVAPRFFVFGFGRGLARGGVGRGIVGFLRRGISGVVLFWWNASDPVQLWMTLDEMRKVSGRRILVCADQEGGGYWTPLREGFTVGVPPMALASTGNTDSTYRLAKRFGKELSSVGVNTVFAPVVDINTADNPIVGIRSFGADVPTVCEHAKAFIRGVKEHELLVCLKHFPGHGPTTADSHEELPRVEGVSKSEFFEVHLAPYARLLKEGVDMVMTAHVLYSAIDSEIATFSKRILTDILRRELSFEGVVITDCLEMNAASKTYPVSDAVVKAFNAGADLLLFSHTPELQAEGIRALERAIESGEVPKRKVEESLERVERLLERLPEPPELEDALTVERDADLERELAVKSVCVVQREPLGIDRLGQSKRVVAFWTGPFRKEALEKIREALGDVAGTVEILPLDPESVSNSSVVDADLVLVCTYFRTGRQARQVKGLVEDVYKLNANLVHVSFFQPYDVLEYDFVPASMAVFGTMSYQIEAAVYWLGELEGGRFPSEVCKCPPLKVG